MSGIGNLKQVISTTQAVERVQEAQNRSNQTGQQHFAESLQREAEDETTKVKDNPDVRRPEDEQKKKRDEREQDHEDGEAADEATNQAADEDDDDDDVEHHVDVIA